jgi:hypothetical protein
MLAFPPWNTRIYGRLRQPIKFHAGHALSNACTLSSYKLLTTNYNNNNSEGDTGFSVSKVDRESAAQNVHFVDGDTPWSYDIKANADETTKLAAFTDAELGDFLSRPIKIKEYQWTPGVALSAPRFNPWTEFFDNADVLDKINRYRNLRCNLRMKVLVNGNSFYYGRALLTYNPYIQNDEITVNRAFIEEDLIQASQKPHLLLDPTTSQGGEMLLPFIWPENYLNITAAGWNTNMGEVDIHDFDVLQHANGGTDPISITIFCWAENLTLAIPTTARAQSEVAPPPRKMADPGRLESIPEHNLPPPLVRRYPVDVHGHLKPPMCTNRSPTSPYEPQGFVDDSELDEFGFPKPYDQQAGKGNKKAVMKANNTTSSDEFTRDGLISKPASAIAKAADALSMIPVLAPYAKATSMVSTRVGDIARIFGYSRPQVLEDTRSYVPRYLGNLSNSDAPEPLVKLSLDSKNELSIDTRLMGLGGEDELTVNSICQRWSYFRQFDWPETAVTDTMLTSMIVAPIYGRSVTASPVTEIHSTALAFGASPFDAWQGSIKFRFNVVCSEYHRGRIRIVYNPATSPGGAIPFNQTYSTIVDISENRDFEYEVKWADVRAWANNVGISGITSSYIFADDFPILCGGAGDNGSLSVYVVNELATPATTAADVKIQVWVAAGDDFALAVPTTKNLSTLSVFKQQSEVAPYVHQSEVASDASLANTEDKSNSPTCTEAVASFAPGENIPDDNQYLVYQGERIVSFREMLRRYHYFNSYWPAETGNSTQVRVVSLNHHDFPYYRGWEPGGEDAGFNSGGLFSQYNFCTETLLNYLTPAFACRRGGLRHKYSLAQLGSAVRAVTMSVSRHNLIGSAHLASAHRIDGALEGDRRKKIQETERSSLGGSHATIANVNPVLEFETPYYTRGQRFEPARRVGRYSAFLLGAHDLSVDVPQDLPGSHYRVDRYISVAEDFQLGMFTGAPIMYSYSDPFAA